MPVPAEARGNEPTAHPAPIARRLRERMLALLADLAAVFTATIERDPDLARMDLELERRVAERTAEFIATITELEAFTYSVSHDLRAPVRTISGLAETLLAETGAHGTRVVRDLADRIHRSALRMDGLIDVLLQLSAAARVEPQRVPIDISAIAREELGRLGERFPDRKIECVVQDGVEGFGDRPLVAIVLHNLLANAWKFTSHVVAARIDVGTSEAGGERAYFVRDNGIGFDMEHAEDLFVPFRQLHSQREFEGTGVGLAIVHRIVTHHGGRVWAESSPGDGAVLFFTLPQAASGTCPLD